MNVWEAEQGIMSSNIQAVIEGHHFRPCSLVPFGQFQDSSMQFQDVKKQKTMSADGLILGTGASVLEYQKKATEELLASLKHQVEFMTKELSAFDKVSSLLNGSHS
jgi:hypothetical protein